MYVSELPRIVLKYFLFKIIKAFNVFPCCLETRTRTGKNRKTHLNETMSIFNECPSSVSCLIKEEYCLKAESYHDLNLVTR